jgi:hypothetical protein
MTATKPDLCVRAVAYRNVLEWLHVHGTGNIDEGRSLMLVDVPSSAAASMPLETERDMCTPGFVSGVVRALATAGVSKAGGPGVAALHRRALALSQAVQSIGRVLKETTDAIRATPSDSPALCARSLSSISEICTGVAADVFAVDPGQAARATLAAHGWTEGMFPALPGKRPHNWAHTSMYGYAWVEGGLLSIDASVQPPAVLRAFATLAEETRT